MDSTCAAPAATEKGQGAEALGSCEGEAARETVPLLGLPLGVAEAVLQLVRVGLPVPVAEGVSVEETVVEVLAV